MIKKFVKNKFLNERPIESIAAAALIISMAGIGSRLLGLLRDRILAGQFGAGDVLDAYYAAFRIPDLIYNLMIVGALSAAFIPVFTELISKKREDEAWELSSGILSLQIIFAGIVCFILIIFSSQLMKFVTPGYSGEKMDMVVKMTKIMFLSPFFLGISGIIGGVLVSFKKFLIYSLAPIFYNIGIIIGAVFFVDFFGPIGLAWGVALGSFMHMIIQYPALKSSGFHFNFNAIYAIKNPEVKKVLKLMIPRTLTIAVSQINFTIITIFASTLTAGSLAVFNLANNIQSAPLGLFGVSFAIAIFPTLSAYAAKKQTQDFVDAFSKTLRQILFFVIPISIFIFVLRAQIVRVVLGSGKFNWDDTILTFQTLGLLIISLFAQSMLPLLTRTFYALQNTKIPLFIAIISEGINLVLAIMLMNNFGVFGLALAFSVSSIINMFLLAFFLRKYLHNIDGKNIINSFLKITLASFLGGIFAQTGKIIVGTQGEIDTFIAVFIQLFVASFLGISAFCVASYFLKIKEFFQFKNLITRKLLKVKKSIQEDMGEVSGI